MSASWVATLKGMMNRGTATLVQVDQAHAKNRITDSEKDELYAYWYTLHPEDNPNPPAPTEPATGATAEGAASS